MGRSAAALGLVLLAGGSAWADSSEPILEAIPQSATEALFIESLPTLEPAVSALESALGAAFAYGFVEEAPLPYLAMQDRASGPGRKALGLDAAGGLGLFRMPGFEGPIGLLATLDEAAAMSGLIRRLREGGAQLVSSGSGVSELAQPDGTRLYVFFAKGYLYLAMPDGAHQLDPALVEAVRAPGHRGLASTPVWHRLASGMDRSGAVVLFRAQPLAGAALIQAVAVAFVPRGDRIELRGFIATESELQAGPVPGARAMLRSAPEAPVAALSVWLEPQVMKAVLLASPSSEKVLRVFSALAQLSGAHGWQLEGGVDALAYAAAPGDDAQEDEVAFALIEVDQPLHPERSTGQAKAMIDGDAWEVRSGPRSTLGLIGKATARPRTDALASLQHRFGPAAFGRGHASLLIELGAFPGSPFPEGQGSYLYLDVAAAPGGATVSGELRY